MEQVKIKSISVIIPYYNDFSVFKRTLESILNQTLLPQEVIIVDDCSDDSHLLEEMISNFNAPFEVKLYRNKENKNGAYSRNLGIKESKCEYIALLDADDFWQSKHLEDSYSFLQNSGFDFIYSNIIKKFDNGEELNIKVTDILSLDNPNDILFYSPPQTNSFFFRKSLIIKYKLFFDERLRRHQDWQFLISILNSELKVGYGDFYTSYYCESIKPFVKRVNYQSIFTFWNENLDKFSENKVDSKILHLLLNVYYAEGKSEALKYLNEFGFNSKIRRNLNYFFIIGNGNKKRFKVAAKFLYYIFFKREKMLDIFKILMLKSR